MAAVHDLMRAHEAALQQPLLDFLSEKNSLRLLGPRDAAKRAPTLAVDAGADAFALSEKLAPYGIMAGGGDFYAVRALEGMGVEPDQGVLRLSFVHYTSQSEISKLMEALDSVLK